MSFWNKLLGKETRKKSVDTAQDIGGWVTLSGLSGSPADEFSKSTWFFACVKYKAESASQVPLVLKKGDKKIVLKKANEFFTWREIMEKLIAWLDIKGIAYLYIPPGTDKFYLLDSDLVRPVITPKGFASFKYFVGSNKFIEYSPDEIVVFYNFNPFTRLTGVSNLEILKQSIDMSYNSDLITNKFFEQGAIIPGFLSTTQRLTEQDIKQLQSILQQRYGGVHNAWKIPVLGKGLSFVKTALTPADYEALNTEKITKNRISTVEGVPATLLNDTENLNYATAKIQREMFWENTLIPLLGKIEDRISVFLTPKIGYAGWEAHFDYSNVKALKEDIDKKVSTAVKLFNMGVPLNVINEKLNLGLPELPWGWDWYGPINITQLGTGYTPPKKNLQHLLVKLLETQNTKERPQIKIKSLPSDRRVASSREFIARVTPQERKLARELMKYWKRQEKWVIDNILPQKAASSKKFPKEWDEELAKILRTHITAFAQQAGEIAAARLGVSFSLKNDFLPQWIWYKTMSSAVEINMLTRAQVAKRLQQVIDEGGSVSDMIDSIKDLFEQTYASRAQTVARTEVFAANNHVDNLVAARAGMRSKQWLTAEDERVRDWHAEVDGQSVGVNAAFLVNGEFLTHPGDPEGSPENVINCRCTMLYSPNSPAVNNEVEPIAVSNNAEETEKWVRKAVEIVAKRSGVSLTPDDPHVETLHKEIRNTANFYKVYGFQDARELSKFLDPAGKFSEGMLPDTFWRDTHYLGILERLTEALPKPKITQSARIMRGIRFGPKYKEIVFFQKVTTVGSVVSVEGPTSFTVDPKIAKKFSDSVILVLPKGYAPPRSFYFDQFFVGGADLEKEILISRTDFKVVRVRKVLTDKSPNGVWYYVYLEPVKGGKALVPESDSDVSKSVIDEKSELSEERMYHWVAGCNLRVEGIKYNGLLEATRLYKKQHGGE